MSWARNKHRHVWNALWQSQLTSFVLVQDQQELEPPISLASWDIEKAAVFSINISDLSNKDRILELLPALTTLTNHNRYLIDSGNEDGFFRINKKDGISYLHFTKKKPVPGNYSLQISSIPLYKKKELNQLEAKHDKRGEWGRQVYLVWNKEGLGGKSLTLSCLPLPGQSQVFLTCTQEKDKTKQGKSCSQ